MTIDGHIKVKRMLTESCALSTQKCFPCKFMNMHISKKQRCTDKKWLQKYYYCESGLVMKTQKLLDIARLNGDFVIFLGLTKPVGGKFDVI